MKACPFLHALLIKIYYKKLAKAKNYWFTPLEIFTFLYYILIHPIGISNGVYLREVPILRAIRVPVYQETRIPGYQVA